jgi:hypothetical protein
MRQSMETVCIAMRQYINILCISGISRLRRSTFAHAGHELHQFTECIWLCNTHMNGSSYTNPCNGNVQMNPYRTSLVQSSLSHSLNLNSLLHIYQSSIFKRTFILTGNLLKSLILRVCLSVRMCRFESSWNVFHHI